MPKQAIQVQGLAHHTYSDVVKAGNTVYISGQTAQDAHGQLVGVGDFEAQAVRVYENLKIALSAANATFDDVVKMTVYVTDMKFRTIIGEVRGRYMKESLPANTFVVISCLARPELLLSIDAIAVVS
jgi:2-iminobutanoate/2-iminopropanoate deaminase